MRVMVLLLLSVSALAWDNSLEGTIYDRDVEGIPRAAWVDLGRIMNCVVLNERYLDPNSTIPIVTPELQHIRLQLRGIVALLRKGEIKTATDYIDLTMEKMQRASWVDCPHVVKLR